MTHARLPPARAGIAMGPRFSGDAQVIELQQRAAWGKRWVRLRATSVRRRSLSVKRRAKSGSERGEKVGSAGGPSALDKLCRVA
jgi:hypothetical protein